MAATGWRSTIRLNIKPQGRRSFQKKKGFFFFVKIDFFKRTQSGVSILGCQKYYYIMKKKQLSCWNKAAPLFFDGNIFESLIKSKTALMFNIFSDFLIFLLLFFSFLWFSQDTNPWTLFNHFRQRVCEIRSESEWQSEQKVKWRVWHLALRGNHSLPGHFDSAPVRRRHVLMKSCCGSLLEDNYLLIALLVCLPSFFHAVRSLSPHWPFCLCPPVLFHALLNLPGSLKVKVHQWHHWHGLCVCPEKLWGFFAPFFCHGNNNCC